MRYLPKFLPSILLLAFLATPVLAQDSNNGSKIIKEIRQENKQQAQEARQEIKQDKVELRQDVKQIKTETKNEIKPLKVERKEATGEAKILIQAQIQQKREETKLKIEASREALKQTIEVRREEVKKLQETRREELKVKLQEFKDQRKAQIAERVDLKFTQVNTTITTKMTDHLNKLTSVITTLEERVAEAKTNGKDTTLAESAIAQAKLSISSAQSAVTTQAGKDYGITTTSESTVKNDVAQVRTSLNTDLKTTQESIKAARLAVENALKVAASTLGEAGEATPNPTQ